MISVIVPVYRVEQYLDACIESILGQTFQDFELILVDDGSPDNCGEICDRYAGQIVGCPGPEIQEPAWQKGSILHTSTAMTGSDQNIWRYCTIMP